MINQIEPWICKNEIETVSECISSTFVTEGKYTKIFEEKIQNLHRCSFQPVAYCNATAAIYASLKVLGIKNNQEVIIPALTFVATANAVIMAGGVPVCVDIDDFFNLDLKAVKEAINSNTFAVMPVHLYGHFTNVESLRTICDDNKLMLIEDASQGVGVSNSDGIFAGTVGDIGVLSFYGNKFITSAQGGMIISKDPLVLSKLRQFKNHGRVNKGTFWHEEIGLNFCTSDLNSSLGVAQLERFEEIKARKKTIFDTYKKHLSNNKFLKLDMLPHEHPCYWFVSVFTDAADHLNEYLTNMGIQSRRAFPPLSMQPCYKDTNQIKFTTDINARALYSRYLSLPSSATLCDEDILKICNALNQYEL